MKTETYKIFLIGLGCILLNAYLDYKYHFLGIVGSLILGYTIFKVIVFAIKTLSQVAKDRLIKSVTRTGLILGSIVCATIFAVGVVFIGYTFWNSIAI